MEKQEFVELKKQIEYYLPEIKTVRLWNNQFVRSNGDSNDGRKENAFGYPCVFIQFHNQEFMEQSLGIQEFHIDVTLHLGYKSFVTDDLAILDLKEKLYWVAQRFQAGNWARLARRSENWNYDHDNINVLEMTFHTYGRDDYRYVFAGQTFDSITATTETVTVVSATTQFTNTTASDLNGSNMWFSGDTTTYN